MSKRSERNNRKPKTGEPSRSSQKMLAVLNLTGYQMYLGTVPEKVKARRRAANRAARISRRANRNG